MSPEEVVDFFLLVFKHSDITTDWWAAAADFKNVQQGTASRSQKDMA